jgi:hypothetical protein
VMPNNKACRHPRHPRVAVLALLLHSVSFNLPELIFNTPLRLFTYDKNNFCVHNLAVRAYEMLPFKTMRD